MKRLWLLLMVMGLAVPLAVRTEFARAQFVPASGLDVQRVPWKHLRYRANNWAVTFSATMTLDALPSERAEAVLLKSDRGTPLKASGPQTLRISLDMTMDFIFRDPVLITNKVWFNPDDATALGRLRVRRGEDDFEKIYRFTAQGVFRRNREPQTEEEAALGPDRWSRSIETFYPHDPGPLGCPVVTERLLLIYIVSAMERLPFDQPFSVCVFGKRQLHRVTLSPEGQATIVVDFLEKKPPSEVRRKGRIDAIKIGLAAEPLASDLDKPENFSFLGLHKNIVIYMDPRSNLPLQVSGDIPKVGSGDLKLLEVNLK
jgi:hypothetical protein